MIRFYKLYSLFLKAMDANANANANHKALVKEWCLCEKLPRAVLHIPLDCNLRCELCGLERRPKTDPSSSDEEEAADNERQKMLLERRRAEKALEGAVRVKVAKMRAKKPVLMMQHCKKKCTKCGRVPKSGAKDAAKSAKSATLPGECKKKKLYSGYFGHSPKPMGAPLAKWRSGVGALDRDPTPTAPPQSVQHAFKSMWEPSPEETASLVVTAREVPSTSLQPSQSDSRLGPKNEKRLVNAFIPLRAPITDPSGGAISKRRSRIFRTTTSRPLRPLSKVVATILAEKGGPEVRAKGGGLSHDSLENDIQMESQFCPFENYEGPSEDALVVDSRSFMLREPPQLLPSYGSEESVSSSKFRNISSIYNKSYEHHIPQKTFNLLDAEEVGVKAEKTTDPLKMFIVDQVEQIVKALGLMKIDLGDGAAENEKLQESKGSGNPTTINDVSIEHVISSNKYQTDEKYSKVLSKKLRRIASGGKLKVCDKCGHHRNADDVVKPNVDSSGPYRKVVQIPIEAEAYTKKSKKFCRLSAKLVGKQKSGSSLRAHKKTGKLHRTLHSPSRTVTAGQKLEGRKPSSEDSSNLEEKFHKTSDGYGTTDGRTIPPHILSHSCMETEVSIHWQRLHTLETVSHVCSEILKPRMATHICNVKENLKSTYLDPPSANMAIYEFRMPDIESNAIEKSAMSSPPIITKKNYGRNKDMNASGSETPVAHSPTPRHMNLFSRKLKATRRLTPPMKYNRRKFRTQDELRLYEVTGLSSLPNPEILMQHKESVPSQAEMKLGRRIRREHSLERRFNTLVKAQFDPTQTKSEEEQQREHFLKVKLEEMATKPIQLLTPHEGSCGHSSSTRLFQDPLY